MSIDNKLPELLQLAEKKLRELTCQATENPEVMSLEAYQRIFHDLRVHQIELEMQNEELRQTHAKLDSLRARYFNLYELAPIGYCTLSEQGKITESNFTAATMLGLDRSTLVDMSITKFIFKDDQDVYYFYYQQLIKSGQSRSCELRMVKNNGSQLWIRLEGIVVPIENNSKKELRLTLSDISDRVVLNDMNYAQEIEIRDLYLALNSSSIVVITDALGNITYVNDKFCQISKYSREELIGQNHRILKSGYHSNQFYKELWNTISSGNVWTGEIKNKARDGTFYWVMTTIVPLLDEQGKPTQYASIRMDITKKKNLEQELFQTQVDKRVAQELINEKRKFIDSAVHELRNPISALSLLLQAAEKRIERGQPLAVDLLAKLQRPTDRLARLVADLFDVSRQERGLVVLVPEDTNITLLISECLEEFKVQVPKRSIIFNRPDHPIELNIDPLRITQVLTNLLDNAIKYTRKEGAIEVTLVDKSNAIRVSVTDQGAGIPKDQQLELFRAFSRGNTEATARASGLGLGLSICKGIIDLHHGTIGVESVEGQGSTFYFELPKKVVIANHHNE